MLARPPLSPGGRGDGTDGSPGKGGTGEANLHVGRSAGGRLMPVDRVLYSQASHGEAEIAAVMDVLRGGPQALRIGPKVTEMERRVAALFGKSQGLMCNSGSSALMLAQALLDLPKGSEVITSPLTFSTDIGSLYHLGLTPVFVDVEPDTFNVDAARIEEMVTDKTKALFFPNLAGNAPDWDIVRQIADGHGLAVVE